MTACRMLVGQAQPMRPGVCNIRPAPQVSTRAEPQHCQEAKVSAVKENKSQIAAVFPGATEPGTGARHSPSLRAEAGRGQSFEGKERQEKFEMKTTKDYYQEFPGLVRSSFPLYIKSAGKQEPLGKLEQASQDAGPQTGHRRMPDAVDREGRLRPRTPFHPDTDRSDLLRELDTRHL